MCDVNKKDRKCKHGKNCCRAFKKAQDNTADKKQPAPPPAQPKPL